MKSLGLKLNSDLIYIFQEVIVKDLPRCRCLPQEMSFVFFLVNPSAFDFKGFMAWVRYVGGKNGCLVLDVTVHVFALFQFKHNIE